MTKPIDEWIDTYDPQFLAEKYGLTVQQAKVVISSNGPSKHGCDVGAIAFVRALAWLPPEEIDHPPSSSFRQKAVVPSTARCL